MDLDDYTRYDATGLADLVASGQVSRAELVTAAFEATATVNATLNAVVETFDDLVESPEPVVAGPFSGVPTMVKDLFHGEVGRVCGNGSRLSEGWVVPVQTEFAARLRACGLVPVGRTTTSELGIMGTTETVAQGRTCSPWSAAHMAGGSSGGAAAAVGAGIVPVASASDGGGSIRIPASACGVVGLKPSRGRVTWGPNIAEALGGWAVRFFVTRSVRDAAALLDAMSAPGVGDPFVIPGPLRPFAAEVGAPVERLRVAYWSAPWSGQGEEPEVTAATEATALLLETLGHDVEPATPTFDWAPFLQAMTDVWAADNAHTIANLAPTLGRVPSAETLEASTLASYAYGTTVTATQLLDAADVANAVARVMGRFFATYDVLLTPTLGRLPSRLGVYEPTAPVELKDVFSTWSPLESFLPVFNATGQPAISLPLRTSEDGLPIGMQLVGGFGTEARLLRLAAQLEAAAPWSGRRPPIHAAA